MKNTKRVQRLRRGTRVRAKIGSGSPEKLRMVVFRSNRSISVQLVDDTQGKTLASAHSLALSGAKMYVAQEVGKMIAEKALAQGIRRVVFDRSGYAFHGRIKALAEAAREGGLHF